MLKNQKYINKFAKATQTYQMSNLKFCQHLFVLSIKHKGNRVNLLRYKLYFSRQRKLEAKSISPCFDSLKLHSRRAVYQSHIWRKSLVAKPETPTLIGNGWGLDENDPFCIKWNNVNPAPDEVLELMFCTYSRKCVRDTCPCVDNGPQCIDATVSYYYFFVCLFCYPLKK